MSGNWNWKNEIVSEKKSWNNPGINQFIPEAGISRLYSVVRESLQNSIDARPKGSKNPVVVEFEYIKDHDISIIPDFSSYVEYCRSSIEYNLKRNRGNAPMVQDMKATLETLEKCEKTGKVDLIRIGDYNTVGLEHVTKNDKRFDTVLSAEGSSVYQGEAAGGTFGFGKYASFIISQIRTVIYHTYNKQNEHGFAAKTIMGTFPYKEGNSHYTNINKFVTSNNKAIAEEKEIKKFIPLRNEKGTDIYILAPRDQIGFSREKFLENISKEITENFFIAINDKELECKVIVGNKKLKISSENIVSLLEENYKKFSKKSDGTYHSDMSKMIQHFKPCGMFFLNAYKNGEKFTRSCKKFKSVDIYILTDPKDHNDDPIDSQHTLWIRKLKMKVKLDTFVKRKDKPYVALIVINNKDGNEYMASIENHQHNGLDPTRLSGKKQKIAQESIKKVQEELDKILEDLRDKGSKQQLLSETDWWIVNLPGDPTSGSEETNPLEIDYISKSTDVFEEIIEKRQDPFAVLIRDIDGEIFEPGPRPEPSPNPNPNPSPTPKPRHRYKAIRGPIDRMRINHINENKYEVIVITNEDLSQARFVCYGSSDNKEKERRVNILKAYNDNENFRVTTNTFLAKNLIRGKNKFFIEIDQNIKISPRLWMLKDNEKGNNNE